MAVSEPSLSVQPPRTVPAESVVTQSSTSPVVSVATVKFVPEVGTDTDRFEDGVVTGRPMIEQTFSGIPFDKAATGIGDDASSLQNGGASAAAAPEGAVSATNSTEVVSAMTRLK